MADATLSPEEFDLLAAELALGLLEGGDRVRALRLQLSDRGFRMAVAAWQERLAPMLDEIEADADPAIWPRIEAALGERSLVDPARQLRGWRIGAVAAAAVAFLLALLLVFQPFHRSAGGAVAQLVAQDGTPLLVARLDQGHLRVRAEQIPADERVPELWVIPADGKPRSLGTVARSGSTEITFDPATRTLLRPGATLALTLEPAEGIPHQAPTGDILAKAPLSAL